MKNRKNKEEEQRAEPDFSAVEKKFIKRATDRLEDFGLSWDYIGDYATAFKHSQIRDLISGMSASLVHGIAVSNDVSVEEGVMYAEEIIDVIKFVYENNSDTEPTELKRFVLSEIMADMKAAGDWKTALRFMAYIDHMPVGYDWDNFKTDFFEEWIKDEIALDTIQDGYIALQEVVALYPIRHGLKKIADKKYTLPLEKTPQEESGE